MRFALWLLAGGAIGAWNVLTLWWTVGRMRPDAPLGAVTLALGGALLRWGCAGGLLILALQRGIVPGLLACAGLSLARWGLACWLDRGCRTSHRFEA